MTNHGMEWAKEKQAAGPSTAQGGSLRSPTCFAQDDNRRHDNRRDDNRWRVVGKLDGLAAEEVDQFDDQDYDHHQLQDEGAGLVELLNHEAVEVFGGLEFFFDQVFVVGDSDFGGAEFVEARGKHVAEELDGVIGALGEFVDVEQH